MAFGGKGHFWIVFALTSLCSSPAWAQSEAPSAPDPATSPIQFHLQTGGNLVAEQDLFWNFAQDVAGVTDFDSNAEWFEAYVKPGATFTHDLSPRATVYGGLSAVASMTVGTDAFDTGDTGRVTLEEGYIGLRFTLADATSIDLSIGPREFKAGTGMLLASGGSSGFSRGALKLGPRKAWGMSGLARISAGAVSGTAFYLDPNESPDNDSGTRMAGLDLRYDPDPGAYAGLTIGRVLESSAPYPKAAPGGVGVPSILEGARDGLEFMTLYGRAQPFSGQLSNAFVTADIALERNDRIDLRAWAWRVQAGYVFDHRWKPTLTLGYQTFSGDDPDTARLERFDPLYFEGNPSAWSTGTKSSMVFINSNVNALQLSLAVSPTPRDTFTARITRIGVNELKSPIQFGQATRVEVQDGVVNPITGVTRSRLSDDFYLEYSRVVTPNLYLTMGFSVSTPGPGIDSIVADVDAPRWSGGYINLIANY